jgi:DNA-binding FadR family transcriptional regulator
LALRERIASGEWDVGRQLPAEAELAAELGVGRNTAREAVAALAQAGMLERRQGRGTFVVSRSDVGRALTRALVRADQSDVLEVRRALEVVAAELAAERRSEQDVMGLRQLLSDRAQAVRTGRLPAMVGADVALHRAIAQCARNPVLAELYDSVLDAVRSNIAFNFESSAGDDAAHVAIVDAIVRGDPAAAAAAVAGYLTRTAS